MMKGRNCIQLKLKCSEVPTSGFGEMLEIALSYQPKAGPSGMCSLKAWDFLPLEIVLKAFRISQWWKPKDWNTLVIEACRCVYMSEGSSFLVQEQAFRLTSGKGKQNMCQMQLCSCSRSSITVVSTSSGLTHLFWQAIWSQSLGAKGWNWEQVLSALPRGPFCWLDEVTEGQKTVFDPQKEFSAWWSVTFHSLV